MLRLTYLCLEHVVLAVPEVKVRSSIRFGDGHYLSEIIRPVESYSLSNSPECNVSTDAASVTELLEALECLIGTAVELGYSLWVYVDCFD